MEKTLIMSLANHHIYYVTDSNVAFFIALPYQKFSATNITIELRNDTANLTLKRNDINEIKERLHLIYNNIDNDNISLIIPLINANFLDNLNVNNDAQMYDTLDKALAKVINYAYMFFNEKNIKVENEIIMINNGRYINFTSWFMQKYGSRCKYKSLKEMMNNDSNLNKLELTGMNFVIGKKDDVEVISASNKQEILEPKMGIDSNLVLNEVDIPEETFMPRKEARQAGYISYYLLGVISIGISLVILYILL